MTEIEQRVQRLRRCRHCGHRTPDDQIARCGECGESVDHSERGLWLRGVGRGWTATVGTAGGKGWTIAVLGPLLWALTALGNWSSNPNVAYFYGLAFGGMVLFLLLKRLMAHPDALVVAYVGPEGFAQADALPRWPVLDFLGRIVFQLLMLGVVLHLMAPDYSLRSRILILTPMLALLTVINVLQWREQKGDPLAAMLKRRSKWTARTFGAAEAVTDQRVHLKINGKGRSPSVDMEFESPGDAVDFQMCLNHWKAQAVVFRQRSGTSRITHAAN